ncbi:DNA-binding transcriptional LysR family regulator [Lipingzhangella halophila]|uniref:DNA-binding transcriptional LysR family regulator n=1 Tax=Lipingzhangella halophila TaxID=1783352 RepID=A0A7W7W549_9ACTN|nr:LysR family transcriptional regulator [Lipingzhangella halophila]MBB4934872.1 DNA-binding transcriptional LysR family regulator [Lipingzhangella halophila]
MDDFTVAGLRVVREAARQGSFSVAAERLGYTQSAVSRQIALMERAAGQALFERRARGVQPTEAGRVVLRRAEAVLSELQATHQDLQDLGTRPPGRLRLGAFPSAMAALVPRAVATLRAREPRAEVKLREGLSARLLRAVERGRLDLALLSGPQPPTEGVEMVPLLDDPLLVALAPDHRLAGHESTTLDELREEAWVAGSSDPNATLLGTWSDASWQPDIAFVARDWLTKLGLTEAGLGITLVPGLAVPALPRGIAVVRVNHPTATRTTTLARSADAADSPLAQLAIDTLRTTAAELTARLHRRLG